MDVNYHYASIGVDLLLINPRYPLLNLQDCIDVLQYGTSIAASPVNKGLPILRMNNLQESSWDLTDLKYVELTTSEAEIYRLESGDILFNRTNSKELVGKCAVFREEGHWVFASYLLRMRLNERKALPDFVAGFLDTKAGHAQIDRVSRQIIGMSNINAEEIRGLKIPLPPLSKQHELSDELIAAQETRKRKLVEADNLLAGFDKYLLDNLGLSTVTGQGQDAFAVHLHQVFSSKRINPQYFHPERMSAIQSMERATTNLEPYALDNIADFKRDIAPVDPLANYVGLANVQSNTGELVGVRERPSGTCFEFNEGDVLFARLRPYLNKVHCAEASGVCSTEFHVIRINQRESSEERIFPLYLSAILRSSIILAQVKHMTTGNTHPRLSNEDVTDLVVPVPGSLVQCEIISELQNRRAKSRSLKLEAEADWEAAKARFESKLLGGG